MSNPQVSSRVLLGRQDFLRFADHRARSLHADSGTLWVTVDGQPEDIEIAAGESRSFDGRLPLTVGTLGGPAVLRAQLLPTQRTQGLRRWAAPRWFGVQT